MFRAWLQGDPTREQLGRGPPPPHPQGLGTGHQDSWPYAREGARPVQASPPARTAHSHAVPSQVGLCPAAQTKPCGGGATPHNDTQAQLGYLLRTPPPPPPHPRHWPIPADTEHLGVGTRLLQEQAATLVVPRNRGCPSPRDRPVAVAGACERQPGPHHPGIGAAPHTLREGSGCKRGGHPQGTLSPGHSSPVP